MISLIKKPSDITLAGNAQFKFNTDNYLSDDGYKAQLSVQDINVSDGDYIDIPNLENEVDVITLYFKDNPAFWSHLSTSISSNRELTDALSEYYIINKHYRVYDDRAACILETRERIFITDPDNRFSGTGFTYSYGNGRSDIYREAFKLITNINGYEGELMPDKNGDVTLNISDIISALIDTQLIYDFNSIKTFDAFRYTLQYTEAWGGINGHKINTFEGYALKGYRNDITLSEYATEHYLNDMHTEITTWENAIHWLNYLHAINDSGDVFVNIRIFYKDRSTDEQILYTISGVQYKIHHIPAGVSQINLSNIADISKTVYKYQLYLTQHGLQRSEIQTIYLDKKPLHAEQFVYINSYGLPEVINTKGTLDTKVATERETVKINDTNETRLIEANEKYTVRTGYRKNEEIQALKYALSAKEVWWLKDAEYVKIIPDDGSFELISESESISNLEFSFTISKTLK